MVEFRAQSVTLKVFEHYWASCYKILLGQIADSLAAIGNGVY